MPREIKKPSVATPRIAMGPREPRAIPLPNPDPINKNIPHAPLKVSLTGKQVNAIIQWIAEGVSSREMVNLAASFDPPFKINTQLVYEFRLRYAKELAEVRKNNEEIAMKTGLAVRANRLNKMFELAQMLEDDFMQRGKLWLYRVKSIGMGDNFERIVEEEFNEQELRQLRGLYDDIARELGHRAIVREMAGPEIQPSNGNSGLAMAFTLPAEVLAASFLDVYRDIRIKGHTEYVFGGGRGSTKSSFVSLATIYLLVNNPDMNAMAIRQVANTLRDSVYSQLQWAINELGLSDKFKCTVSPMEMVYLPTGQKIYFRGADDPGKLKSIKPSTGYIGILWFEELDQFHGPESVRKIEQSAIRGGSEAWIFKSFNPPRTSGNWANKYVQIPKAKQYQHRSSYLSVPVEWLGQPFIDEAEHLKTVNPAAYEHEYLGVVNGSGGQVFDNVTLRKITDEEIAQFDHVLQGIDWGFYPDPFAWVKTHYDAARMTLYIFDECRMQKAGNKATYENLVKEKGLSANDVIIADSAEPKSVGDYREYGANCRGAEKGPESVKYSMKWLQSLASIVIDNTRCPYSAEEFLSYELEQDKDGSYISEYPDHDNHFIDATRYSTNLIWRRRGQ